LINNKVNSVQFAGDATNITIGNSYVGNTLVRTNLDVSGITVLQNKRDSTGISNGSLVVLGGVGITGNLNIGGNSNIIGNITSLNYFTGNTIFIQKSSLLYGNVGINTNPATGYLLDISGKAIARSDLIVNNKLGINNANPTYELDISGSVNITKKLYVLSDVSMSTDLYVAGNATVDTDVYVNGNTTMNGNVTSLTYFTGNTVFVEQSSLLYGNVGINTNPASGYLLDVSGKAITRSDLIVNNKIGINNANPTYELDISGSVNITKKLFVLSDVSMSTNLYVAGNATVDTDVYVNGNTTMNGNVTSLTYLTGNTVFIQQSSLLYGNVGINTNPASGYLLDVSGKAIARSDLIVNNKIGINNANPTYELDVSGSANITKNLFVLSDVSMNSNLYLAENATINTNLYVNGNTTMNGNVTSLTYLTGNTVFIQKSSLLYGNVGINTNPASGYLLDISGKPFLDLT
jgi:UDP-3-O-[3-hydroxymyristoyl] glucosamine N-acyltransferase